MLTTIVARLDKTGLRVLCGRPSCGRELARITVIPRTVLAGYGDTFRVYQHAYQFGPDERRVMFGPGWQQDESGIWAITKRARHRLEQAHRLAVGNNPSVPSHLVNEARGRLSSGKVLTHRRPIPRQLVEGSGQANHHVTLPTEARCPDCHGINRLDPGPLRI